MGIRFYCPNGHKLNVKNFLAGKRGICPRCGEKVNIPDDAEVVEKNAKNLLEAVSGGPQPDIDAQVNDSAPASSPGILAVATGNDENQAARRISNSSNNSVASPPLPPILSEPLTEKSEVVWYVRPENGGQFGPATTETMRTWLSEGRVGADSLVWREGWSQWQQAGPLFPLLRDDGNNRIENAQIERATPKPPTGTQPLESVELVEPLPPRSIQFSTEANSTSKPDSRAGRGRSNQNVSLMVVILLVMSILGLLPVLIYVVMQS